MPQTYESVLLFGPDRVPFVVEPDGTVRCSAFIPFHGIISRGLLAEALAQGLPLEVWHRRGHLLQEPGDDPELRRLAAAARRCQVLSFGQSALAALSYLNRWWGCEPEAPAGPFELWNIKEGRTSSVWRVLLLGDRASRQPFILNVARDRVAGRELEDTSYRMREIAAQAPGLRVAAVHDIATVAIESGGQRFDVVVTRNAYVPDAYELHALAGPRGNAGHLVLVERFLTTGDEPARIDSILGRQLTERERARVARDVEVFLSSAARHRINAKVDINDGDVVWDGRRATVVAISETDG